MMATSLRGDSGPGGGLASIGEVGASADAVQIGEVMEKGEHSY
jgi:hypothetical protein